jgi:hypothetical protein
VAKVEVEPQAVVDMYTTVPPPCRLFLYLPEITSAASVTFSAKFDTEAQLLASLRGSTRVKVDTRLEALSERLESLRTLSSRLAGIEEITSGSEGRLIKAVSRKAEGPVEEEKAGVEAKRGIMDVVKGFLPGSERKKEKPEAKPERPAEAKKPGVKTVTHIQHKKHPKKK